MTKYKLFENIKYIYSKFFKKVPKVKLYLIGQYLSSILIPIAGTLIGTIAIYALTNGWEIPKYSLIIFVMCVATFLLEITRTYCETRYMWESTFIRCSDFWNELSLHSISTEYYNVEPKSKQVIFSKAFEALSSNWVGIELMFKNTPLFIQNISGLIVYSVLISIYSPVVLGILVGMSIVNYFLTKYANNYVEKNREKENELYREKSYLVREVSNSNNGKDIRIYKLEQWFIRILKEITKKRFNLEKKNRGNFLIANVSNTIFLLVRDLVAYITLTGMVIASSKGDGNFDVSRYTFLIGIVSGFTLWLNGFVDSFNNLRLANVSVNEYRYAFTISSIENSNEEKLDISNIKTPIEIEFDNVSFTYPDSSKPTINNLSFKIKAGENIALVGENGAGKTTIVKLLCGLYKPTTGEIRINNINIDRFDINEYMKLLSVVFQDSVPLGLSIASNITIQSSNYSDLDNNKLWDVLEKASLKEKVMSLPNREETFITQVFDESGIRLSSGETQKLMLARALYKNAPILILDEPTAALDPLSEEKMYETYQSFSKGNTSIFISHRLASTKFCDRIIYLEHGHVKEEGTHFELMENKNSYSEMFEIQSKYYKEERT